MNPFFPGRRRRLTWAHFLPLAAILIALFGATLGHASPPDPNYNGRYELADGKNNRSFELEVLLKGSRADIAFSASMADGNGAAPDGTGKGKVEDGVLSFKFKDSFNNEGTCTLQPGKTGYRLSMTVTKVVEPTPLHFYGDVMLKKVADTSSKP